MAGTIGLVAGIAALTAASGGLIWAARRKATMQYAPSQLPPKLAPSAAVALVAAPKLKGPALFRRLMEQRKAAFQTLTGPERYAVISAEHLRNGLGAIVGELELPWPHYSGSKEIKARGSAYSLFAERFLFLRIISAIYFSFKFCCVNCNAKGLLNLLSLAGKVSTNFSASNCLAQTCGYVCGGVIPKLRRCYCIYIILNLCR